MRLNLSPSVNIIRDAARPFQYIKTANSRHIFEQIALSFKSGTRSFSIVGSYVILYWGGKIYKNYYSKN